MTTTHAAPALASGTLRGAILAVLGVTALTAGVWLVHVFGRTLPTVALAAVWASAAALITTGLLRRARLRRAAFLAAYLRGESPLARRLRGGWLMAACQTLLGGAIAVVLLVAVVRLTDARAWLVLLAGGVALALVYPLLGRALAPHASREYLPELAWRLAALLIGGAMVAALVALAFHRAYPELGAVSLERAVWHLVDAERARSPAGETLLQLAGAKDALRLWLAQQLMPQPGTSLAQGAGWLIVLAEEALFVWSYLSLCTLVLLRTSDR